MGEREWLIDSNMSGTLVETKRCYVTSAELN